MSRRTDYDDPEVQLARATPAPLSELPMFASVAAWPQVETVTAAEQRGLELPDSLEARYAAWRRTDDGTAAYRWILTEALGQVARGATRLFVDRLFWDYRQKIRGKANNSYRALMVREMIDAHHALLNCFETRHRSAS